MIRAMRMAAVLLLAISGGAAQATSASYQCSEGTRLTADFSPPSRKAGRVILSIEDGGKLTLPQQMSADGGRYADTRTEFWVKGDSATLTRKGHSETCHAR